LKEKRELTLKYHVHGYEFQPYGQLVLVRLLGLRIPIPNDVKLPMDVMWTLLLEVEIPVALLKKYGNPLGFAYILKISERSARQRYDWTDRA